MDSPETIPAMTPPQGVTPNFIHPDGILPLVHFTVGMCLGVSSLLLILRLYTRLLIIGSHGWEDCELKP